MIAAWILVIASVFALGAMTFIAVRTRVGLGDIDRAILMIRALDIEAFRNLIDPAEEAFLRGTLSPKEFRAVKRDRAWAALAYVRCAGKAAAAFARAGQAAQRSSDPQIAESGVQVAERALQLRLHSFRAGIAFLGQAIIPGTGYGPRSSLIDEYQRTSTSLVQLGRVRKGQRT